MYGVGKSLRILRKETMPLMSPSFEKGGSCGRPVIRWKEQGSVQSLLFPCCAILSEFLNLSEPRFPFAYSRTLPQQFCQCLVSTRLFSSAYKQDEISVIFLKSLFKTPLLQATNTPFLSSSLQVKPSGEWPPLAGSCFSPPVLFLAHSCQP